MTEPREDHPGAKAALRARLRAARRALGPGERAAVADGLAAVALERLRAGVVALYDSRPAEPGTRALRAGLAARGLVVVLPVVVGPEEPLAWVVDPGGADGGGGARAWPGGLGAVDVVLLPALAVDRSGTRLGQGGGHYDRTLALLPPRASPTALSPESAPQVGAGTALSPESAPQEGAGTALSPESAPRPPSGTALSPESAPQVGAGTALSPGSAGQEVRGRPLLVAVVRDEELLGAGSLPREAHDAVVDAALTPTGWHELR